jgi:hypothetical protein
MLNPDRSNESFRMRQSALIVTAFLPFIFASGATRADDTTQTVRFSAGASSATIKGRIKGYDGANFLLDATAGQHLDVSLKASNSQCTLYAYRPGEGNPISDGSGDTISEDLGETGSYRVLVLMTRNLARRGGVCTFSVRFEISG